MKKIHHIALILLLGSASLLHAADYQYQYFNEEKEKYTPFSDYIPRSRLHYQTTPYFVEDYYELYGMKQYYNENSLRMNIARLETALQCKFRHPSNALVPLQSEEEYLKYRRLMFMHINYLIMRNYLKIGARYDIHFPKFYHQDFAEEILDSLNTAEKLYKAARPYWAKVKKYANDASTIPLTTELSHMESNRYQIITGEIDYDRIIDSHLSRLERKRAMLRGQQQ